MIEKAKDSAEKLGAGLQRDQATVPVAQDDPSRVFPVRTRNVAISCGQGLAITRRVFLFIAGLIVLLSVYETFSKQSASLPPVEQVSFDALQMQPMVRQFALPDAIDRMTGRRIIGVPPRDQDGGDKPPPPPERGWRAEVREHWALKGTSVFAGNVDGGGLEAIVFDNRAQRMQFLRADLVLRIADQEVRVSRVEPNLVELRSGDEVLILN
jgi:hypothetical protein